MADTATTSSSPFAVEGRLSVVDAATVICLRNRRRPPELLPRSCFCEHGLARLDSDGGPRSAASLDKVFAGLPALDFTSGWEVLMGQGECVNWMRSSPPEQGGRLHLMSYPGEFKLAGGNVDKGEAFIDAARRELEEEFLRPASLTLPTTARLRPLVVKQTLPIRSRSHIMWNFVALSEENPWLEQLDIEAANAHLAQRRASFEALRVSGRFWRLSEAERERAAPEVRELRWLPLHEAVRLALSTMVAGGRAHFVNDFQRQEFARLGIARRDPMLMTAAALFEVEAFPCAASLIRYCDQLERSNGMEAERQRVQWLPAGMPGEEVAAAISARREPAELVKDWQTVRRLRAAREAEEARQACGSEHAAVSRL